MEKIESQLKTLTPEISMRESQVLWSRVEGGLSPRGAQSPKRAKKTKRSLFRAVVAGLVALGLLGGSVVTAYASESLPGDALYSTKLTIERAQIVLAPSEKKKDLQLAFADRRVKEVSAVLADIEEDVEEPTGGVMAMAMTAPVAEPSSEQGVQATLAMDTARAPEVPEGTVATFAVNTAPSQEPESQESHARTMGRAKSFVPAPQVMMMKQAPTTTTEDAVAPVQEKKVEVQKMKRWKNLEKKKKALAIAIHELERSSEELRDSGATTTSDRVDAVIVNLTELNLQGTTPDEGFVERMKNNEVDVLPVGDGEEKTHEGKEESQKTEDSDHEDTPPSHDSSVGPAISPELSMDTQKEMDEVKVRNSERKKRFQAQVINVGGQGRTGLWRGSKAVKRVPVCVDSGNVLRELLVPEKDTSKYIQHGFTLGVCPALATTTLPTEED